MDAVLVPIGDNRDRMWSQYDARVGEVLEPGQRFRVLQQMEGSYGAGITSDVIEPAEVPDFAELIAALRAVPDLRVAAGDVLYLSISNRASVAQLRDAALQLRDVLLQRLGP